MTKIPPCPIDPAKLKTAIETLKKELTSPEFISMLTQFDPDFDPTNWPPREKEPAEAGDKKGEGT